MAEPVSRKRRSHSAPVRRPRLPADARRSSILRSAREAFIANGITGAGMRQIAERAEVDPAQLYRHFPSKEALFEAAILEPLQELVGDLLAEGQGILESPAEGKAEHLERGVIRLLEAMGDIAPLMAVALFSDQEIGRQIYCERFVPLLDAVALAVSEDLATWVPVPVDARLNVTATFTMCFGLAMDAHYRGEPLDPEYAGRRLAGNLMHGLLGS